MKKNVMMVVLAMAMVAGMTGCGKNPVKEDQNALFADAKKDGREDELKEMQDAMRSDRPAEEKTQEIQTEVDYSWLGDTTMVHTHSVENFGLLIPVPNEMMSYELNSFDHILSDYPTVGSLRKVYSNHETSGNMKIEITTHAWPNMGIDQHANDVAVENMTDEQLCALMDLSQGATIQDKFADPENFEIRKEENAIYLNQKTISSTPDVTVYGLYNCTFIPSISDTNYARGTSSLKIEVVVQNADEKAKEAAEQYLQEICSGMKIIDNVPVAE